MEWSQAVKLGWAVLAVIDIAVSCWFHLMRNDEANAAYWLAMGALAFGFSH